MNTSDQMTSLKDWLKSGFILGLKQGSFLIGWGEVERHQHLPKAQTTLFAADFFLDDEYPWWTFEHLAILSKEELQQKLAAHLKPAAISTLEWIQPEQEDFESDFAKIQSAIEMGVIEKAVPVTFERAIYKIDEKEKVRLLTHVLANYGERHVYGLWNEDFGILGASPEILFTFDEATGELETMALAGTRKSEREKDASLLLDPKEMFEHNVVVHDIKRKLKSVGEVEVSEPRVWNLGLISHLRTDFKAVVKKKMNRSVNKLIHLMHPTPALGVASEVESFRWLKNLNESETRARFGAPFGIVNFEGRSEIYVAIRNVQWAGDEVRLGSGCGIVAPSNAQMEWQELQLKRQSVKELFHL